MLPYFKTSIPRLATSVGVSEGLAVVCILEVVGVPNVVGVLAASDFSAFANTIGGTAA